MDCPNGTADDAKPDKRPPADQDVGMVDAFVERTAAGKKKNVIRQVRLPAGWEGLSMRLDSDGRLIVADVPKACFSSAAFGAGAKPQVDGVEVGNEIVLLNGESPARAVERIVSEGDDWNACTKMGHAVGSKGKFESPPCVACDFIRRRNGLGLDVALQMWLRAVKREIQITLGVRSQPTGLGSLQNASKNISHAPGAGINGGNGVTAEKSSIVDLAAGSSIGGAIAELKSLDDVKVSKAELKGSQDKKGKGQGKGKGKGKKT